MYDLAIIGAGWAGFNAAQEAKQLGLKAVIIDKSHIGGTCLNLGCIPTKALIQSAKIFNSIKKSSTFGINTTAPEIDFVKIQERKEKIVQQLRLGMQSMLKGIDFLAGVARIVSPQEIEISGKRIQTRSILIATGSRPYELPQFKFDSKKIISSDEMLGLKSIPDSILIIGGGVIGCEFASLFSILGSKVSIVEKMPQVLPGEDNEVARKLESSFRKKGIKVSTNTDAAALSLADFDIVLVCVGRSPQTQGLGLEELGVRLEKGRIVADDFLSTNINNIYTAGDCCSRIMLAHFAGFQGRIAAQNIKNPENRKSSASSCVPGCIFTDPEIGSVGLNEEKAKASGFEIEIHKFDFQGSGMSRILDETEGFVKIISDKKTGIVLGSSIIGPKATELIGILTLAVSSRLKVEDLRNVIFAHPTLSESISEAL